MRVSSIISALWGLYTEETGDNLRLAYMSRNLHVILQLPLKSQTVIHGKLYLKCIRLRQLHTLYMDKTKIVQTLT